MRMYSFKQLFNIFRTISNQSEVHDWLCKAESNIDALLQNVADLKKEDKSLKDFIVQTRQDLQNELKNTRKELDEVNNDNSSKINFNKENISKHKDYIVSINDMIKKIKEYEDGLNSSIIKISGKHESHKNDS